MISAPFQRRIAAGWLRLRPFTRRARQSLAPTFAQVHRATADVDTAMREIEVRFLDVSATLETTTALGRDLVEHCEALIALALGQGGGEIMIDAAAQHIWHAIEFVERNDQRVHSLIEQLRVADRQITLTLGSEQTLVRTLAPLTFVQTLFRVESASLSHEVREMFHALGSEIERIRVRVETGFREKFALVREIQRILRRAIQHLVTEQQRVQKSVAALRSHLTTSLGAMRASYEKNRDRDTRLIGVSQAVNQATGQVVMALQFQDILNQKLQHTHAVLEEMTASFDHLPADRSGACHSLRFIQQSGQVAAAQLAAMHDELVNAGTTIGGGLREIIRLMETIDGDCVALRDLDSVTTGVDGAVQILLDSLEDVRRLLSAAETHTTGAHQEIAPIAGMTTNFTAFMRELSLEIQLIGLNAEVQSARVGAGTGLEVLSAQTSAISRDTSELSLTLAAQVDTLTSGLDQAVVSFREIRDEIQKFGVTFDAELASDGASLHDYRDSSLKVLHHISEELAKLDSHSRAAHQQADFAAAAARPLGELKTAMESLAAAANAAAEEAGVEVNTVGLTDRFIEKYTMRSQVDVHHEALGLQPAAAPAPAAVGDVELFGDDPPAAPAQAASPPAANIDLWDEPADSAAVAPATSTPSDICGESTSEASPRADSSLAN